MLSGASKQCIWLLALVALATATANAGDLKEELPDDAERLADESAALTDGDLSDIVSNFGQELQEMLSGEMNSLVDEVAKRKAGESARQLDEQMLQRLKSANKMLSEDAGQVIGLAARQNSGELTQASWASVKSSASSFASQVNDRLGSAGSYIGEKMSSLSSMVPTVTGKLVAIPARLRRLMRWPSFLSFKVKFNKAYKSLREELYRQMLYLRSQAIVGVQNLRFLLGRSRYLKKATQFSDITSKEFASLYDNPLAERDTDVDLEVQGLSGEQRERLLQLARAGRDVFGNRVAEARRRKKRDLSELEESEDEGESSMEQVEPPPEDGDEDEDDAEMLDELADQLEDAEMQEIMSMMDEALDDESDQELESFKPLDLRTTGCVPIPMDQNTCGNCYAQAVTAASRYYNCMENKQELSGKYNPRFLSDCGKYIFPEDYKGVITIRSCAGGRLGDTIKFASKAGNFAFYTYEVARSKADYKSFNCAYARPETIQGWGNQEAPKHFGQSKFTFLDMKEVNLHMRTIGPVFVNIRTWKDFEHQGGGIYDGLEESRDPTVHSMLVVGQDRDQRGRQYYIILDSHGTAFADNGFVRIYRSSLEHFKVYFVGLIPLASA